MIQKYSAHPTLRSANAATGCPDQFGSVDDLPPGFFAGMEANVNTLSLSPPQWVVHTLIPLSPSENDAPDELQQPLQVDPRVLLARLSSFLHRSRLNTDEEAEPHPTMPLSSHPYVLISRLMSLFRSQPHNSEDIELMQRPSSPRIVEVAAVRDKKALVVARGPQFKKAKRAYEQAQLHAQAQPSSSQTQPADASTSTAHPAPVTAAAQPPPISWKRTDSPVTTLVIPGGSDNGITTMKLNV
ncbi:hypothetical protein EDD22DRAFT_852510 [Suillus occidentalis]|nr:hypothetical protein EDD22DRAFT_852510 [Suillus occidentalis]